MASDFIRTRVVKNGLAEIRKNRPKELQQIHEDTAEVIESLQKQLCPEDTGALKGSIQIKRDGKRIAVVEGGPAAPYAGYVEHGTANQVAQPHARPAALEGIRYRDARIAELVR